VAERIANLTRAPIRYQEPFQILKYEVGQFYRQHHDQNSGLFTPQGPRVYTFFMYLSTPKAGGATKFNNLGLVVPAVKGNAVLWPSVMSEDPTRDEPYTNHEAMPVEEGQKFASNVREIGVQLARPVPSEAQIHHVQGFRPPKALSTFDTPDPCPSLGPPPLCGAQVWIHNFDYRTPAARNCLLTHKNTH
jgi:hypothetical protein